MRIYKSPIIYFKLKRFLFGALIIFIWVYCRIKSPRGIRVLRVRLTICSTYLSVFHARGVKWLPLGPGTRLLWKFWQIHSSLNVVRSAFSLQTCPKFFSFALKKPKKLNYISPQWPHRSSSRPIALLRFNFDNCDFRVFTSFTFLVRSKAY